MPEASLFTINISRKQEKLQYITAERSKWREEVRNLALKISKASYGELSTVFVELKVRLNAYGRVNNNRFDKDAHIWTLIDKMDKDIVTKPILSLYKTLLIDYLSLLLKYDWECAKKEVKGEQNRIFSYLSLLVVYGIFGFSMVNYSLINEAIESTPIILFLIITLILLIITYVAIRMSVSEIHNDFLVWYCRRQKANNIIPSILYKVILAILLAGCVFGGMHIVNRTYQTFGVNNSTYDEYPLYYIMIFLMAVFGAFLIFITNCSNYNTKREYFYMIIRANEITVDCILYSLESLQINKMDTNQVYERYLKFLSDSKDRNRIIDKINNSRNRENIHKTE